MVNRYNKTEMDKLSGKKFVYKSEDKCRQGDEIMEQFVVGAEFEMKVGAQVSPERDRYITQSSPA